MPLDPRPYPVHPGNSLVPWQRPKLKPGWSHEDIPDIMDEEGSKFLPWDAGWPMSQKRMDEQYYIRQKAAKERENFLRRMIDIEKNKMWET